MISFIFMPDCFKILTLFSLSPGSSWSRKDIQDKVNLYNVPLDKALAQLINTGILQKKKKYYSLQWEFEYTKLIIGLCQGQFKQLRELPLSVYNILIDFLYSLSSFKNIEVFLFGSYSKLIYKENSDIDIALICRHKIDQGKIRKSVSHLEKAYGKKIDVHYFEKIMPLHAPNEKFEWEQSRRGMKTMAAYVKGIGELRVR